MKQKLRLTITKIRRETISGGGSAQQAPVTNRVAERNIREVNAPTDTMPDDYSDKKITNEGKN